MGAGKLQTFFVILASETKFTQKHFCIFGEGGKVQLFFIILASETKL